MRDIHVFFPRFISYGWNYTAKCLNESTQENMYTKGEKQNKKNRIQREISEQREETNKLINSASKAKGKDEQNEETCVYVIVG